VELLGAKPVFVDVAARRCWARAGWPPAVTPRTRPSCGPFRGAAWTWTPTAPSPKNHGLFWSRCAHAIGTNTRARRSARRARRSSVSIHQERHDGGRRRVVCPDKLLRCRQALYYTHCEGRLGPYSRSGAGTVLEVVDRPEVHHARLVAALDSPSCQARAFQRARAELPPATTGCSPRFRDPPWPRRIGRTRTPTTCSGARRSPRLTATNSRRPQGTNVGTGILFKAVPSARLLRRSGRFPPGRCLKPRVLRAAVFVAAVSRMTEATGRRRRRRADVRRRREEIRP
jgi:hypothetical protein